MPRVKNKSRNDFLFFEQVCNLIFTLKYMEWNGIHKISRDETLPKICRWMKMKS